MSKATIQFATMEDANAYRDRIVGQIKVVQGDTAAMVILDDRTLDQAQAERRDAIQAEVQAATLGALDSPQHIYDRRLAALAAIDAAATNDAVDAVTF